MRILVTGATGFIGRWLVKELVNRKEQVYALVRKTSQIDFLKKWGVNIVYGDITDIDSLAAIKGEVETIFHCAGLVENKHRDRLYKVNVLGTENICRLAFRLKAERLVYVSSVAVVSGNERIPLVEELPYKATSLYGESKIEAEKKVIAARRKGLKVCILRPCMVYGKGEPHSLNFILFLLKHRLLPLIDGGRHLWHLVYVSNVVDALLLGWKSERATKETFFVADDEVLTVKEVLTILSNAVGAKPPLNMPDKFIPFILRLPYLKKLKFFLKDRVYSIERIKAIGYTPRYFPQQALPMSI